jgi:hypothetical protein
MVAILDKKYADIHKQLKRDEHWYLKRDLMQSPASRAG